MEAKSVFTITHARNSISPSVERDIEAKFEKLGASVVFIPYKLENGPEETPRVSQFTIE